MNEKVYLDMLALDSVIIKKQHYIVADGKEYAVGEPWRRSYMNTERGREQMQTEVAEPYKTIILMMWGSVPTITEETE